MEVDEFTPLVIAGDGDDVLTVVRLRVRSPERPAPRRRWTLHHHFRFRDGKIAYYRGTEDTLQTLRTLQ